MVVKETILKDWVFELCRRCRSCLCGRVCEGHEKVIECCGGGDCCECCRVVVVDDEELNRLEGEEKGLLIHDERPAFASIFRPKSSEYAHSTMEASQAQGLALKIDSDLHSTWSIVKMDSSFGESVHDGFILKP